VDVPDNDGTYNSPNDADPNAGGSSSPNPDDDGDETARMRGLAHRVRRSADRFTNQGFAPAQTSAVFNLLQYSSGYIGDDGGGVNPRFFGADPAADASTSRGGRVADPDGGGSSQGTGGFGGYGAAAQFGGSDGGGASASAGFDDTNGSGAGDAGAGSDESEWLSGGPAVGPDPENEWGAGGYNPHYQPTARTWTPNQRVGGATRLASVVSLKSNLVTTQMRR
jgi:hypothetical protein